MRLQRRSCGAAAVFHQTRHSIALDSAETKPNVRQILFKHRDQGNTNIRKGTLKQSEHLSALFFEQ